MSLVGLSCVVVLASVIVAHGSVSEDSQCNEGPDSTALLQGIVHVDRILTKETRNFKPPASVSSEAKEEDDASILFDPGATEIEEPPFAVEALQQSKAVDGWKDWASNDEEEKQFESYLKQVETEDNEASLSSPSSTISVEVTEENTSPNTSLLTTHSHVVVAFSHATSSLTSLAGTLKSRAAAGSVLLVLLLLCCVIAAVMVILPAGLKRSNTQTTQQRHGEASASSSSSIGFPRATPSRGPTSMNLRSPNPSHMRLMEQAAGVYPTGLTPANSGAYPAGTTPQISSPQAPPQLYEAPPFSRQVPPPLCPTLVMPVCEARFGVPMSEIAQLHGPMTEGAIGIVGLSGNALLRAVIRLDSHQQRTLEICMPEPKSAPRATVAPSRFGLGTHGYDICGMKGRPYGFLEIEHCGSCHVEKDGQTVLVLDGDTDNSQLIIKSGLGSPLASVRCSVEPFGGVEHVEIHVECGVDTVLVLAVVLGVLVLSQSSDDVRHAVRCS